MTSFEDRERAFEAKFAHDEEMNFRANARRSMWLGLWAAKQMGMTGESVVRYARGIVRLDLEEAGVGNVVEKVEADMAEAGVTPATPVREKAADLLRQARESVLSDTF